MMRQLLFLFFLVPVVRCTAQQATTFTLFFATNSSSPAEKEADSLKRLLNAPGSDLLSSIAIYGYCDQQGSTEYNDSLSEKRAAVVKNIVLNSGINPSLITAASGKGEIEDKAGGSANRSSERAYNRRVDVLLSYKPQKAEPVQKTAAPKSVLDDNLKVGARITLKNILFIGGRHVLLAESYPALDSLVQTLKEKKQYSVIILGHVCCQPPGNDGEDFDTGQFNLSVTRAKAVYDYLVQNGIDPARLDYKGLKSDFPTGKGDKYDRRVEIEITKVSAE